MTYFAFIRAQYRFLVFGFLMMALSNFGQTFFISLYADAIKLQFGLSNSGFGALYSTVTLLSAAALLYTGKLIDETRLPIFTGFVFVGLGLAALLMGLTNHIALLAIALFGLRHFGQALAPHTGVTATGRAYLNHRGQAVSLVQLGYAAAEGVLPMIAVAGLAYFSWQQNWLIFGLFLLFLALPLQVFLTRYEPPRSAKIGEHAADADDGMARGEVLRDWRFYCVLPLYTSSPFLLTGLFFHQLALADERDWPLASLALGFSLYAGVKVVVSLLTGPLIDRFSARRLLPVSAVPLMLALSLLVFFDNLFGSYTPHVYMCLIGMNLGLGAPLSGSLWPELFGTRHLGAIRSLTSAFGVTATAAAPVIFGFAIDAGISFAVIAAWGLAYLFIVVALAFSVAAAKIPTQGRA